MRVLHDIRTGPVPIHFTDGSARSARDWSTAIDSHNEWTKSRGLVTSDPITHRQGSRRVTDVIVGNGTKELVGIRLTNGERITATAGHPFWDEQSRSWVDAEDLSRRDRLLKSSERELRLTGSREYTSKTTVYNLTVAGLHTFSSGGLRFSCTTARFRTARKFWKRWPAILGGTASPNRLKTWCWNTASQPRCRVPIGRSR